MTNLEDQGACILSMAYWAGTHDYNALAFDPLTERPVPLEDAFLGTARMRRADQFDFLRTGALPSEL